MFAWFSEGAVCVGQACKHVPLDYFVILIVPYYSSAEVTAQQWCARRGHHGPIVEKRALKCPLGWQNTLNCPHGWLKHDKLRSWVAKTHAKVPSWELKRTLKCPLGWQNTLNCPYCLLKHDKLPSWVPKRAKVPSWEPIHRLKSPLEWQNTDTILVWHNMQHQCRLLGSEND